MQPDGELVPNQRKPMKAKRLSLTFFYFSESALFNGLRARKRKKSARLYAIRLKRPIALLFMVVR
jgi:hypothetical protein